MRRELGRAPALLIAMLVSGTTTVACVGRATVRPSVPASEQAALLDGQLAVVLPSADSADAWLAAGRLFHWSIGVPDVFSASIDVRGAGREGGTARQIVAHGTITRCNPEGHVLQCGYRLPGGLAMTPDGRAVAFIRDSAVLVAVRRAGAPYVWRSLWSDQARRIYMDSVPVVQRFQHPRP